MPPQLAEADARGLDALERQRLITVDSANRTGFSHPFYRATAESLLDSPTQYVAQSAASAVERGLFCLSSLTSRATARNLDWVFDKLEGRPIERQRLVAGAVDGLRSTYPATRDLCFRFLVRRLGELPAEHERELPTWIALVTSFKLADLEWVDGEAHLAFGETSGLDYLGRMFSRVSRADVAGELESLDTLGGGPVTPERAAATLAYLADEPESMTLNMIGRLLSYDEAALRAEATEIWLSRARESDDAVLERIFADDHPSCALAALKGIVKGWDVNDTARCARQLDGLELLAGNSAVAAVMLGYLVVFDRVEHTGEDPPWRIFECLMPIVMATLPHSAVFVDARLFAVAQSALDFLPASSMVALCDGWIDWLERNERAGHLPGDFALAVGEILIAASAANPQDRGSRLERLVSFSGTGANLVFVADLVDQWDQLRDDGRAMLLARLHRGRSDDLWLQATALTRSSVPAEIVADLLPDGQWLADPEQFLDGAPQPLVEAAIRVYCGRPQPLWWLGTHHRDKQRWEPIVETVVRRPDHSLFELAWDDIVFDGDGQRVAGIIADIGAAGAEQMFEILLRQKVVTTGDFMPEAWAALLRLPTSEQRARWLDRMAEMAPAIVERLPDLSEWLSEPADLNDILERLSLDFAVLQTMMEVFDPPMGRKVDEAAVRLLEELLQKAPPQLYATCDRLLGVLKNAKVDAPVVVAALTARRMAIFDEIEAIKKSVERDDAPLLGWIDP